MNISGALTTAKITFKGNFVNVQKNRKKVNFLKEQHKPKLIINKNMKTNFIYIKNFIF